MTCIKMARVCLWVTVVVSVIISTASHVELKCLYAVNDSKNPREGTERETIRKVKLKNKVREGPRQ